MNSKFNLISIGIVAKDKLENSLMLDIYPIEIVPNKSASPIIPENLSTEATSLDKEVTNTVVVKQEIIKAKWIPDNSNSIHAPMMCKGERVEIYQFDGKDQFYWRSVSNEIKLRKNEKTTLVWSNKKTMEDSDMLKNIYYLTVDTINKLIRFHTDDSDSELTTYDIDINTADGTLTIVDGRENIIELNSADDVLTIKTNKKIITETLDQERIVNNDDTLNVTNNRTISVGANKKEDITGDETNTIGGSRTETITGRHDSTVGNFTVSNGADEIISLLGELTQAIIDIKHIGNLGAPTAIEGGSKSTLSDIKSRIMAFK